MGHRIELNKKEKGRDCSGEQVMSSYALKNYVLYIRVTSQNTDTDAYITEQGPSSFLFFIVDIVS